MRPFFLWSTLVLAYVPALLLAQPKQAPYSCGFSENTTVQVPAVWPGSVGGFGLTGNGSIIYQWEAASNGKSHPDTAFASLVGQINPQDTFDGISGHATTMARIMVGNTGDSTQGVAYGATVNSYTFRNFWPNMRLATTGGMQLSNHAYGFNGGASRNGGFGMALKKLIARKITILADTEL